MDRTDARHPIARRPSGTGGSLAANVVLLVLSLVAAVAAAEGISRIVMPVRAMPFVDQSSGRAVDIRDGTYRLRRNLRVRQTTKEFDVVYATTADGNRGPDAPRSPEVVFIGDSFTFGYGVNDHETFVHLFCAAHDIACANLGRMGTGTGQQVEVLRSYMEEDGWRPRQVRLMMFVMTGALMNGNDLTDNLTWEKRLENLDTDAFAERSTGNALSRLVAGYRYVLQRSNLVRIVLLYAGPMLRAQFSPAADAALLSEALALTGQALARLDALARRYGFSYDITLIHPMQDILRGTDTATADAIRSVVPAGVTVRSTGSALRDSPARYYYSFDMHLNAAGHRAIAALLSLLEEPAGRAFQAGAPMERPL